jgi:putative aldouronate transport system permease protein
MQMKRHRVSLFDVVNYTMLFAIALICVYPFIYIIAVSLSDATYVSAGEVWLLPRGFTTETYKYIFENPRLNVLNGIKNSVIFTVLATLVSVCFTYTTAYVLSRKRFPGRYALLMIIFFTMLFSGGIIPEYLVNKSLGLLNNIWVMIIPNAISVWVLIITKSYLDTLPVEIEEAAIMDGANEFVIMLKIFAPISAPILATITVFYAVGHWNSYLYPLIYLQDVKLQTIQLVLARIVTSSGNLEGAGLEAFLTDEGVRVAPRNIQAAAIFITTIPILLIYPFAQKYFTKGLLIGSLKG